MNTKLDLLALAAGLMFVTLGLSGVLNSTGLAPHPGWLPPTLVLAALAGGATVRNVVVLLRPSADPTPSGPPVDGTIG